MSGTTVRKLNNLKSITQLVLPMKSSAAFSSGDCFFIDDGACGFFVGIDFVDAPVGLESSGCAAVGMDNWRLPRLPEPPKSLEVELEMSEFSSLSGYIKRERKKVENHNYCMRHFKRRMRKRGNCRAGELIEKKGREGRRHIVSVTLYACHVKRDK